MNKKTLLFVFIGAVLLIGLFALLRPKTDNSPTQSLSPSALPTASVNQTKTFDLIIKDGKLTTEPNTFQVREGESVTFNITSDTEDEFHLHGYDKSVDLVADQTVNLSLVTDLTGRFIFELEHQGIELGALEVMPR